MAWLEHLFHEPRDVEVGEICAALRAETVRHSQALGRVQDALMHLGEAYDRAEQERLEDRHA